jgi:hypothetical protein
MNRSENYLDRREARIAALKLKHQIVFGYGVGAVLVFLGGFRCYLVAGTNRPLWQFVLWIGASTLLVTLLFPSIWTLPERGFRWIAGKIGHVLFLLVLSIVYFLMICPGGWWLRRRQGVVVICEWTDNRPSGKGWQPKTISTITHHDASSRRRYLLFQPFLVLGFFIEHRTYFLVPVVIILIVLGLILFFVQTSALAPFIYTLF